MKKILKVEQIQKYYGNKDNITKAIDGISFEVEEGEFIGIMGASGSGKTTLLNCISTIDNVSAGHIYLENQDITEIKEENIAKFRRENLGFIFQDFNLLDTLTIEENIALMFTIIIIGGNVALLMNNMLSNEIEMGYPFEIMVSIADGDFSRYKEYIEKNAKVKDMYEYRLYNIKKTGVSKAFDGTKFEGAGTEETETVLSLTDYNKLREILGYEKVSLQDDEIIINCLKTAEGAFEKYIQENNIIKIVGKDVKIKEIRGENLAQVGFNGYYYTIIVPDSLVQKIEQEDINLRNEVGDSYYLDFPYNFVVTTEEMTDEKFYDKLCDFILTEEKPMKEEVDGKEIDYTMEISLGNVQTKGERMSQAKSFYAIISFLAFYIALIFVMATATLLAIQQLSDSEKYKYRYELLKKLGMDELQINKTIFKQLFFYFAIPMLIPVLVSVPAVLSIGSLFAIAVTMEEIIRNMFIILGMLILVYGIYFIATDVQFDRNINGSR